MKKLILKNISIICAICLIVCVLGGFTSGSITSAITDKIISIDTSSGCGPENTYATAETTSIITTDKANPSAVAMYMNGIRIIDGIMIDDTTYVPLRAFFDVIGDQTDIAWNADTKTATVSGTDVELSATIGNNYFTVNDRCFYLPDSVLLIDGSVCLPIRELAKVYQAEVTWDEETSAVSICTDDAQPIEDGDDYYNEQDLYWLSHLISAESGNQPLDGKIGVGNVVLNRVADSSCPDSIYGVIFDNKYGVQFSVTENGTIYDEPNDESVVAAKICLEGYNIVGDSMYFVNPQVGLSSWFTNTRVFVKEIGEHDFYA